MKWIYLFQFSITSLQNKCREIIGIVVIDIFQYNSCVPLIWELSKLVKEKQIRHRENNVYEKNWV